ncbi:serine/threonine protein kinase [Duganella sp. OV458]|nr:serine/threonine protein kinase [Duganella sp. OV458]SDI69856.1 serine/threonine protein kinase [Duganella sp. OV510]
MGGYSRVFAAWDSVLQRHVAIKRMHAPGLPQDPHPLLKEARLGASLKHTAFVRIFAIEKHQQAQVIVMELIEGETLTQRLVGGALPMAEALDIIGQIAEAMHEAHQAQLIHGDLKPSNVMLEPSCRVRILDFGLARSIDPLATESAPLDNAQGTIAYMAPERLLGQSSSPASDVYALGVVLYELIAGHRPHAGLRGLALAAAHLQLSSRLWDFSAFRPECAALVHAMTAQQPADRLQSMDQVTQQLRAIAVGQPPPMPPAKLPPGNARWLASGALALAALAGMAWLSTAAWQPLRAIAMSEADMLRAGMASLATGDRDNSLNQAIADFDAVLKKNPRHAAAAAGLSLAYSLRYAGDGRDEAWLKLADASAQQALRLDNQLALAHAAQASVLEFQGHYPGAQQASTRALQLDPLNALALLGHARLLIAMHRYADAEHALRDAMQLHPRERRFADLLGTLHYRQGDYAQAERDFRLSLKLQPNAVYAYANLSAALLSQNRSDEALQLVQQGLMLQPDSHLYSNLGTILYARGAYAGAADAFEQAASSAKGSPNNYLVWANLADALRWLPGRQQDAQHAYQRASDLLGALLQRSPDNINRMSRYALYQARLGQPTAALEWSQRASDAAPASPEVQFRAALTAELTGRRLLATQHLARARQLGYPANLIDSEPDLVALRRAIPTLHQPTGKPP